MELDFSHPQVVVCVGKPKRGKSWATRFMIMKNTVDQKIFKFGIVFSRTGQMSNEYDYIPEDYVYDTYDPEILQDYLDTIENSGSIEPNFVVFDDQQGLLNRNDPVLQNFVACHRHFKTTIFWNFQYLYGSSPLIRECTTIALLFNSKGERTLKGLYENFGQLFENWQHFKDYFLQLTSQKYVAMLYIYDIDDFDKNYLYFKAPSNLSMIKNIKLDY